LHNWASHPSDAFAYGCQVMAEVEKAPKKENAQFPIVGHNNGYITTAPLETLWRETPRKGNRV